MPVERVNISYHTPANKILLSWASGVYYPGSNAKSNPFDVTSNNPNTAGPNSGPYPVTYATCQAGIDGNCTIALTGGFTPSVNLVVWEYNRAASAWFLLGNDSALYQATFDATYTQGTFKASEGSILLVQSSGAITANAWTDGTIDAPTIGAAQEGF
jgi:hypothetical protein